MNNFKTMDANEAVSNVAYKFSELCGIYPITPASPMAEKVDVLANSGEVNFWGNKKTTTRDCLVLWHKVLAFFIEVASSQIHPPTSNWTAKVRLFFEICK